MSNNIDAAFLSVKVNECFVFAKKKYVIVNYAPGGKKKDLLSGPVRIGDGFPMFAGTIFENGIDCAFDTSLNNEAFIFSGDQCAKTDYGPYSPRTRLLLGPIPITAMFPSLRGTLFEYGIDASFRANSGHDIHIHIFRADQWGYLDITSNSLLRMSDISVIFPTFIGTVFASGIDAAFNTHNSDIVYVFKNKYYAEFNFNTGELLNGYIKRIRDDWPALHSIL